MTYSDFSSLEFIFDEGVAWVTIDHPPINLFDIDLMKQVSQAGRLLEEDDRVRVIVFQSANPEFFIAHADVEMIRRISDFEPSSPSGFQRVVERYRTMEKISIGKNEGCARGGGSEFLLSLDMRFGAIGKMLLSQPEVGLGILPGGSGTVRLPRLMGRSRALEVTLGCEDFDAELAERYGWINRALPADEINFFVDQLARRIANFPRDALIRAKRSVVANEGEVTSSLVFENQLFHKTLQDEEAKIRMGRFLKRGGQTAVYEKTLAARLEDLAEED